MALLVFILNIDSYLGSFNFKYKLLFKQQKSYFWINFLTFCLTYSFSSNAQCISAGPNQASIFTNDPSIGTIAWNTPANAQTSNNVRATASGIVALLSTDYTNYLVSTGYGFSIPVTAIICGIEVIVERRQQGVIIGSSVNDNALRIVKNGIITGTNHSSGVSWPSGDQTITYGSPTDLWGTTWTAADINNANFGVASVSAALNAGLASLFLSAEIDQVLIRVYYDNMSLPIELINFDGSRINNNTVLISWSTASESNNDFFTIERSVNAYDWEEIKIIDGAGTSSQNINYTYTDENNMNTISYYRLKQTDFNSEYKYSTIISVSPFQTSLKNYEIFPNPGTGSFKIASSDLNEGEIEISVKDINGGLVFNNKLNIINSSAQFNIDVNAGIYIVKLSSKEQTIIKKIVVQKTP